MPLIMASENKDYIINKIRGSEEVLTRLKNLGFVPDAPLTVLQKTDSGIIVKLFKSTIVFILRLSNINLRAKLHVNSKP